VELVTSFWARLSGGRSGRNRALKAIRARPASRRAQGGAQGAGQSQHQLRPRSNSFLVAAPADARVRTGNPPRGDP
jgi:hypothetical protein